MNSRISTSMMFNQSVSTMLGKQTKLAHLQEQLSTGKKLVTAKDDPVAAGTAVGLDRTLAALDQFEKNANTVQNRLGLQENTLAQAGELMARVNDLTIEANNAALTTDDRKAIAAELASIRESLLSLANGTDGNGRYLFGGTADDNAPFAKVNGQVVYNGDQNQRRVEVAADTLVSDALPGSEIFMRIRTGDGTLDAHAATANTGTGLLLDFGRSASGATWNGESYTLQFSDADADGIADTYTAVDGAGNTVATGAYTAGDDIAFGGVRMRIDGQPGVGDSFAIGPSGSKDVFATIGDLVDTLNTDVTTPVDKAVLQNNLQTAMRDIKQAASKMIDARASGGAQLAAIDSAADVRGANEVTLKTTLSSIRDLDYAEAIGQYQLEQSALQAAQSIFLQMQGMSLFDRLG